MIIRVNTVRRLVGLPLPPMFCPATGHPGIAQAIPPQGSHWPSPRETTTWKLMLLTFFLYQLTPWPSAKRATNRRQSQICGESVRSFWCHPNKISLKTSHSYGEIGEVTLKHPTLHALRPFQSWRLSTRS
jgi:hypothetical protein